MSTDLKTQIREYAAGVEREQEPITVDEVRLRVDRRDETDPVVGLGPSVESQPPARGPWPAMVAAVILLIIFGVFVFVFPGEDPPPVDTLPDPMERELGYYVPSEVPEGFVLQDMAASEFGSSLTYIRDTASEWLPGDGGFQVGVPFISPAGLPEDPEEYLSDIVESNPGASRVETGGRPGAVSDVEYVDGPVDTTLVSLVVVDEQGAVFEVVGSGMTREELLSIAGGVDRVTVDEFVGLGLDLEWDLRMLDRHNSFEYEVVPQFGDWPQSIDVVLGLDVLARMSIARPSADESPVVTTEDGSIVEPDEGRWSSSSANLYVEIADDDLELIPHIPEHIRYQVSPRLSEQLTDRYLERVRDGEVLSEDPYIVQAPAGPEPQFDTSDLGEELSLEPVESLDAIPTETLFFRGRSGSAPVASERRPVMMIGTAGQPESEIEPATVLLWFTELPGVTVGLAHGNGIGSGGASYPLDRYGIGNLHESRSDPDGPLNSAEMSYSVPFETSVVQIVTEEGTFWQRPIAGYGVIPYGDTVPRPTTIIAFDADGDQIEEWEVPAD